MSADWVTTTTILEDLRGFDNHVAWRRLVDRFHAPITRFARGQGLAAADAEDVTQEALAEFARAYRDGRYDRDKGRLSRWLFGIVFRKILQSREKHQRDRAAGQPTPAWEALPDERRTWDSWDKEWEEAVWRICLDRVRMEFEPPTLAAFERVVRDERPIAATAEELGLTVKAVYNAKHRVLKRLRELKAEFEFLR